MLSRKISINHILKQIENKRVLMRVDFNVPLKDGAIKDPTRIKGALPSIKKILECNPKGLVLMSHLGRPDGNRVEKHSLKPLVPKLEELLGTKVTFLNDCVGKEVQETVQQGRNGQIFLLENLRFHPEEEGKYKDSQGNKIKADKKKVAEFRKELTSLGELYVNDAFGTAHRAHSSMVGIDHKIRASGYLLKKELDYFGKALENPNRPFLVILGGAKVKDKIQLIDNLIDKVDEMIIGGGMAFTFLKRMHNINIGKSLFDEEGYKIVDKLIQKAKDKGVKLHLPVDFLCGNALDNNADTKVFDLKSGIPDGWWGLDAGPQTMQFNAEAVSRANTIVWNGPQGMFEIPKFKQGSSDLLNKVVNRTQKGSISIIGGGDTVNLVGSEKASDKVSHVSTGGGASLELLEGKELPGVAYLTDIDQL
ncbi:phosphoglycerate kinase, putative [Ichthyophthirius multifiliis]|uniref:Phosphoglycerate kinase n=1 Tax=Ichthyophthirius multifiliis TaxID=5932 RepID=G0QXC5_ICHMU|nr:phosphoglycerate kinase, putative [Ichthyophthirius multifiliis]EGR30128.1 phosphoglycerate kinase, putative [Ichthyophthirius multifiliis]|eukprot:XP_004031364.1 phosphoglycerate kinase, putative [Ichthyophthirius multifiliis]